MLVNAKVKVHYETTSLSPEAEHTLCAHRVPQATADMGLLPKGTWCSSIIIYAQKSFLDTNEKVKFLYKN